MTFEEWWNDCMGWTEYEPDPREKALSEAAWEVGKQEVPKREWVGLESKDRSWVVDEWQKLTRSVKDTEFNKALRLCKMLETKLKEKNT